MGGMPYSIPKGPVRPGASTEPYDRRDLIERTRKGIALLIVSVLLNWLPIAIVQLAALILGAIAAILILLGADAFGARHKMFAGTSITLFVLSFLGAVILIGSYVGRLQYLFSSGSGPSQGAAILETFESLILWALILSIMIEVAWGLILFDLAERRGRFLMIASVGLQILISVSLAVFVFDPIVRRAVTQAFASNPVDTGPLVAADQEISGATVYALLDGIPAILLAAAYYGVYVRPTGPAQRLKGTPDWLVPPPVPPRAP